MATTEWTGAVSGVWNNASNWSGSTPGVADTALFRGTSVSVTDVSSAVNITNLVIMPAYTGDIGGSGNELNISVTGRIEHYGPGELWFKDGSGTTAAAYICTDMPDTVVHLGGDTITDIFVNRGAVTLDGDLGTCTHLVVGYTENINRDVTMTLTAGASAAVTELIMKGGSVTSGIDVEDLYLSAGSFTQSSTTTKDVDQAYVSGGRCNLYTDGGGSLVYCTGGTVDLGSEEKTIATVILGGAGQLEYHPTAQTLTTLIDMRQR